MKLNVGCGEFPATGWINIDTHNADPVHPDIVADIRLLPFADGTARDVYLGHVLEHIPAADLPDALTEVRRVLDPADGRLCVVGPDLDRMEPGSDLFEHNRAGAHRWPGDDHQWDCTETVLLLVLAAAGFAARPVPITSPLLDGWPVTSRIGWQTAILAAV